MKKLLFIGAATLIVSNSTFAGGILTNTNQHAAFLRMLSRGATTEIDGALSNPAGLSFLPKDGFHVGLSIQSAYQTRNIDASFMTYSGISATGPTVADKPFEKYYEGTASAPVIPSLFAAYKKGDWTISGFLQLPPEVEKRLLTTDCLCSMPRPWQVSSKAVWKNTKSPKGRVR